MINKNFPHQVSEPCGPPWLPCSWYTVECICLSMADIFIPTHCKALPPDWPCRSSCTAEAKSGRMRNIKGVEIAAMVEMRLGSSSSLASTTVWPGFDFTVTFGSVKLFYKAMMLHKGSLHPPNAPGSYRVQTIGHIFNTTKDIVDEFSGSSSQLDISWIIARSPLILRKALINKHARIVLQRCMFLNSV